MEVLHVSPGGGCIEVFSGREVVDVLNKEEVQACPQFKVNDITLYHTLPMVGVTELTVFTNAVESICE
jgi:hypothetical protein